MNNDIANLWTEEIINTMQTNLSGKPDALALLGDMESVIDSINLTRKQSSKAPIHIKEILEAIEKQASTPDLTIYKEALLTKLNKDRDSIGESPPLTMSDIEQSLYEIVRNSGVTPVLRQADTYSSLFATMMTAVENMNAQISDKVYIQEILAELISNQESTEPDSDRIVTFRSELAKLQPDQTLTSSNELLDNFISRMGQNYLDAHTLTFDAFVECSRNKQCLQVILDLNVSVELTSSLSLPESSAPKRLPSRKKPTSDPNPTVADFPGDKLTGTATEKPEPTKSNGVGIRVTTPDMITAQNKMGIRVPRKLAFTKNAGRRISAMQNLETERLKKAKWKMTKTKFANNGINATEWNKMLKRMSKHLQEFDSTDKTRQNNKQQKLSPVPLEPMEMGSTIGPG